MKYLVGVVLVVLAGQLFAAGNDMNTPPAARHGNVMKNEMSARMRAMGIPEPMVDKYQMMMQTRIDSADPEALMANDELNLKPEQIAKLREISQNARQQARELLTTGQLANIQRFDSEPNTMAAMQQKIMGMRMNQMRQMQKHEPNEPNAVHGKPLGLDNTKNRPVAKK